MRDMVLYGFLRLALWAVIWWLLTVAGMGVILAGVLAALIAMLISILALNRLRDSAAMRWKEADDRRRERKGPDVDEDASEEDALLDGNGDRRSRDEQTTAAADSSAGGPSGIPQLDADDPEASTGEPTDEPAEEPADEPGSEDASTGQEEPVTRPDR